MQKAAPCPCRSEQAKRRYMKRVYGAFTLARRSPETVDVFVHPLGKLTKLASLGIKSFHAVRSRSAHTNTTEAVAVNFMPGGVGTCQRKPVQPKVRETKLARGGRVGKRYRREKHTIRWRQAVACSKLFPLTRAPLPNILLRQCYPTA